MEAALLALWSEFVRGLSAELSKVLLDFAAKRIDTPTVVKTPEHDPAEDQFDKDYAMAVAAGRA